MRALAGDSTMTSRLAPFALESALALPPRAAGVVRAGLVLVATLTQPHISQTPGGYRKWPADLLLAITSLFCGTRGTSRYPIP